ncbi:diguanylate phosphodiesterase [Pseudoalteromonas sp. NBT06-2]|uniref:bifunctional diguanylate cyclase/phosphodiesterase n=1 Tax=Pseudoalteromonas sp. NBT06-2 TaxID=2025950 RepID=UPI000BA5CB54|nr:EAL domain-containing protein [Pseudoalteromonas sp. NBT06-2]PAJ73536.1 diguanylate phosphodiesterase [Pseudoalteromonas sp. NBT06-2]
MAKAISKSNCIGLNLKYSRLPYRYGRNSLSVKLSVLISVICLIAGMSVAVLMLKSERKQLIFEEYEALKTTGVNFIRQFDQIIDNKIKIATKANFVVKQQLFEYNFIQPNQKKIEFDHSQDSVVRSIALDGLSAAYIPQSSFNDFYEKLFYDTEVLWQIISPTLTRNFFNFYFISKDNFIRVSPPNWAVQLEPDHQFSNDLFYSVALEENNPSRSPKWTPVYYDNIWHKWIVSLIVPLYYKNEFLGITGSDLIFRDLIKHFSVSDKEQQFFIFNKQGQILSHPSINNLIEKKEGGMNQLLETSDLIPQHLKELVQLAIKKDLLNFPSSFIEDNEVHIVNIHKIASFDWYIGVYKKRSSILSALDELEIKFFGLFIIYTVLVVILLHQSLNELLLKRVITLVHSVNAFGKSKGKSKVDFPEANKDEIGALNGAFKNMSEEITKHLDNLDQRIIEKEEAELAAKRLIKAVEFSGSAVVIADSDLNIVYVNPKMPEMTGYEEKELIGSSILKIIAQEMQILVDDIELDLKSRHYWRGDTLFRNIYNKAIWVSLSISPIRNEDSSITSYVACAQDISFVKESQRKMEQLAYYDTLTGLSNRAFFRMQLRKSMALAARGHYSFALFYFDLDEFKRINDTLGHDAGDQLLLEVANRLKYRLRTEDTIARLGGDEFAVLLSGINDREKAREVANTIQETLSKPIKLVNDEVIVSASIGITLAPQDSSEEDQLLKHADLAMYEAKAKGRNTYHFYNSDLNAAAKERMLIENELRVALKEKQFELYYQPQLDSRTRTIVGYEALIRWFHPVKGMISPDKFIPIAESTGIIVELGEWVLWEACRFAKRLVEQNIGNNVSINLSARQFKDSNLVDILSQILKETDASANNVHLELTESMLMGDIEAAIVQLHELKALGLSLSIDDFGTGFSSLSYLKRFPVDILKIDRSFVKDIPKDASDMAISAAIIAMATKLKLNLVAEGVETVEQIEFLEQNGCYIVQGYYFSPPLPERKLEHFRSTLET